MNKKQLKSVWEAEHKNNNKKRIHRFNAGSFKPKGKIQIDDETYVHYDYTDPAHPKVGLKEQSPPELKVTTAKLPSYPVFRGFLSGVPSKSLPGLQINDFFIIDDIQSICVWRDDTFELVS